MCQLVRRLPNGASQDADGTAGWSTNQCQVCIADVHVLVYQVLLIIGLSTYVVDAPTLRQVCPL